MSKDQINRDNFDQKKKDFFESCENPIGKASHEIHVIVSDSLENNNFENEPLAIKMYEFLYHELNKIAELDFNKNNDYSNCTWSKMSSYYP